VYIPGGSAPEDKASNFVVGIEAISWSRSRDSLSFAA
jgi:hypothetical protein